MQGVNRKKVLVIGKDRGGNLRIALLLKRLDYDVFVTTAFTDIFKATGGEIPDLILFAGMPQEVLLSCIGAVRADGWFSDVKIVIVNEKGRALKDVHKTGADGYMEITGVLINPAELYRTVQRFTETNPRGTPRLRVSLKTRIYSGKATSAPLATMISENGIFVRTMNLLPEGTVVRLSLDLPHARPMVLEGEVIYRVKYNSHRFLEPGMGILFRGMGDYAQEELRSYIEEHLTGDFDAEMLV